MNQREDGPHRGHEKAPFNTVELMPPPIRTESFWEPFKRLKCSLKEKWPGLAILHQKNKEDRGLL